jgi:predicted phosphodiesterase
MRIAVISDIHGNAVALDAVIADIARQGVEQVVCLGDALQDGPQLAEVAGQLRALGCPVVLGNADAFVLRGEASDAEPVTEQQLATREWSLARLSDADRDFVARFQQTVEIALGSERRLLCFHGSPASYDDVLLPETSEEEFQRLIGPHAPALLTGGHTHLQQLRRLGSTVFFNPGSVGLAYDRLQTGDAPRADPWAEYAVVDADDATWGITFRRVPFDVAAFVQAVRASGSPAAAAIVARYM